VENKIKRVTLLFFAMGWFIVGFDTPQDGKSFVPRIHFTWDSFVIPKEEKSLIDQNVRWLKENPYAVLILEGHCDEWGQETYNLELGDKRAREVKSYLIEQGIDSERVIMVVSYGEEKPLDRRSSKKAWALNRRVEFVLR